MPSKSRTASRAGSTRRADLVLTSKVAIGALGLVVITASTAGAQPGVSRGQTLYEQHCQLCHGASGTGDPSTFPALQGNDQLANTARTVRSISLGGSGMPPFPDLSAEDVSSLTTYVRNAWTNDYGVVTPEDVTAVLERLAEVRPPSTVWSGVFTEAQAARGRDVYAGACAICHGRSLNGAPDDPDMRSTPPLARARFARVWEGRSLAALFEYTRATMPEDNPHSLTAQETIDVVAYMLSVGGMPTGDDELRPDPRSLARVALEPQP